MTRLRVLEGKDAITLGFLALVTAFLVAVDPMLERLYDRVGDGSGVLHGLAVWFNASMNILPLAAVVLVLAVVRPWRRTALALAGALLLQAVVVALLKHGAGRLRPITTEELFGTEMTVFVGPSLGWGYSFPSGHAAAACALATVLSRAFERWRWPLFGLAVCVCVARVQSDAHFFGDVFAGAVVGYYVARGLLALMGPDEGRQGAGTASAAV